MVDDHELFLWYGFTDEKRLALFPVGAIVRDSHHHESDTPRAGFEEGI